jgi:hypothetical protein
MLQQVLQQLQVAAAQEAQVVIHLVQQSEAQEAIV